VLPTYVVAASRWAEVDTWPFIYGGCQNVTETKVCDTRPGSCYLK
jgi:hypothetical protein